MARQRLSSGLGGGVTKQVEQARLCDLAQGLRAELGAVLRPLAQTGQTELLVRSVEGHGELAGMGLRSRVARGSSGGGLLSMSWAPEDGRGVFGGLCKGHLDLVGDWRLRTWAAGAGVTGDIGLHVPGSVATSAL